MQSTCLTRLTRRVYLDDIMSATLGQHKQLKTSHSSPLATTSTTTTGGDMASSIIAARNDDNIEDDDDNNDSEMMDGVSDEADNDNTLLNDGLEVSGIEPENASSNFARTFFNNTRRRMSSGLVLSYNFLKGASIKRRDST